MKDAAKKSSGRISGMSLDEAAKILNVETTEAAEKVKEKFSHQFKANSKESGGSFYIQSKIVRARERFEAEWDKNKS